MATDPNPPAAPPFALQVERLYAALVSAAPPGSGADHEPSLGGKLLYAGLLDADARALLVAANIAGAASLAFSTTADAPRQAVRDGVVDFLVTSLDEALRILKNEIRKRETVAVCVAAPALSGEDDFARQLLERGVKPDLAWPVKPIPAEANTALLAWSVASEAARWLPRVDALALRCLDSDPSTAAWAARRWLRLAPRYLGRMALGVRLLRCNEQAAARLTEQIQNQVESGEIPVSVEVSFRSRGESVEQRFSPL